MKDAPPVRVALAVQKRYGRDDAGMAAGAVAFAGFFSLFPLLLIGASAVGFVLAGHPAAQLEWTRKLANAIPGVGGLVGDNLRGLIEHRATTGLVGLAGLGWSGTGIVRSARHGMARIFHVAEPGGLLRSNLRALSTLVVLGGVWLASTAVAGVLGAIANGPLQAIGVAVVAFAADAGAFLLTYRLLIAGPGPPWRRLVPGAVFAAAGWTTLKLAGAWYVVRTVANARAVYGTFAAAIGVLAMLMLGARILMYGAALNAVLIERGGAPVAPTDAHARKPERTQEAADDRSTLRLVREIAGDTSTLVRKEVELAKQEILEAVGERAKVARSYMVAGVLGFLALMFAGHSVATALGTELPDWAGWAVVSGALLLAAGTLVMVARALHHPPPIELDMTKRTVKEDVEWAKTQLKR